MTKLSERKTRLNFTTDAEVRYRGRLRPVIIEVHNGFTAAVRVLGTRQRYEFSWAGLHDWAAKLHAEKQRALRRQLRKNRARMVRDYFTGRS